MKTIAIIGARAGSKGLRGKNLLPIAGKPLLVHTIEHAKASGVCDIVLVSTEDEMIAKIARAAGAVVLTRPPELAEDHVPAEPVLKHALETYEQTSGQQFDAVVYMQVTDLFRTPAMIRECVERLAKRPELESVFVAYETHKNFWQPSPDGKGFVRLASELATYTSRQSRKRYIYREDTGLACATRAHIIKAGRRVGDVVDIVSTHDFRTAIDIHTPFDFWLAEQVLQYPGDPNSAESTPVQAAAMNHHAWLGENVKDWSQSIRNGYARSFIVFALHETGVFNALRRSGAKTSAELARECKINAYLLDGVLNFLAFADKFLVKEGNKFRLSERGEWLYADSVLAMSYGAVGAYSCLLTELVPSLREQRKYGVDYERQGDLVAKGSYYTGKANYPWVVQQMVSRGVRTFADLGCGSGDVLIAFCQLDPTLRGVGIDISDGALKEARERVAAAGLSDRIKLVKGDFTRAETFYDQVRDVDAFSGIMSFHEFLRDGEEPVVQLFAGLKKAFPKKLVFVGEFNRLSDEEFNAMPYPDRIHPLFYQYIIHPLTWQGLPTTKARWLSIFERAGLQLDVVKDDFPFRLVEYILKT